jgi:hypothetical protein
MMRCRVFDHRYRFTADGPVLRWTCQRGCGAGGAKTYASARDAERYARSFDREDRDDLGRRAPLLGMFPLRIWHRLQIPADQRRSNPGHTRPRRAVRNGRGG